MTSDVLATQLAEVAEATLSVSNPLELGEHAPSRLYHYTTLDGFLGIVTSRTLWCTDVRFMNDPSEAIYSRKLVTTVLSRRFGEAVVGRAVPLFDAVERYAASLSANGDLLQQWRAYCRNGRGVAIGMPTELFKKHERLLIGRVEYKLERQLEMLHAIVDLFADKFDWADTPHQDVMDHLAVHLATLAIHFKSPAYQIEEEYRLHYVLPTSVPIGQIAPGLQFRSAATLVIPYLVVPLIEASTADITPFDEIVLGPCLETRPSASAVQSLLAREGLTNVKVYNSQVPMRHA